MTDAEIAVIIAHRDALLKLARDGWHTAKIVAIHAGLPASEKIANHSLDAIDRIESEIAQKEQVTL